MLCEEGLRWGFVVSVLGKPGGDLLFHALRRSTIGAEGFHGRVRDGIGCWGPRHGHQAVGGQMVWDSGRGPASGGLGFLTGDRCVEVSGLCL